jgi:hypothetical protein
VKQSVFVDSSKRDPRSDPPDYNPSYNPSHPGAPKRECLQILYATSDALNKVTDGGQLPVLTGWVTVESRAAKLAGSESGAKVHGKES